MRRVRWIVIVAVAGPLLTGCSDDPSQLTASELWGLWAAVEMVYTSQADASVEADLVGEQGATYTIELQSDGTFASLLSLLGTGSAEESGSYEVSGGRLILDPAGGPRRTLELDFNRSLLTAYEADASWDFNGDGTGEAATLHLLLDRF
ncbi:MAG TPA: hypothetical protein VMM83_05695 [Longimicrobiales bacterium]|nr:hypothetical protein [Longimicrobiales bacterium]